MPSLRHFYLSYSRESSEDSEFALKLAKDLRAADVDLYIDTLHLEPGQSLEDIMAQSTALLVILSPDSVKSPQVQKEVSSVQARGKWVVAILFRTCELPWPFEGYQPFDFRTDYAGGLKSLREFFDKSTWGGCGGVEEEEAEAPARQEAEPIWWSLPLDEAVPADEERPGDADDESDRPQSAPSVGSNGGAGHKRAAKGTGESAANPFRKVAAAKKKAAKKTAAKKTAAKKKPPAEAAYKTLVRQGIEEPIMTGAPPPPPPLPEPPPTAAPQALARDNVQFTLTGPAALAPGEAHQLLFWVHVEEQRSTVLVRAASDLGLPLSDLSVNSEGPYPLERGSHLSVRLEIAGLNCVDNYNWIIWTGEIGKTTFIVEVPAGASEGTHIGSASIRLNECEIAKMSFLVRVGRAASLVQPIPSTTTAHRKAFASYASEDRAAVLSRVQGMQAAYEGLDVFVDVMSLRSGQSWEPELVKHISEADVFYLFWCHHAKASEWVSKEWHLALQARGLEFIDPVPLEAPDKAPPPQELAAKHFNAPVLAFIATAGGGHS